MSANDRNDPEGFVPEDDEIIGKAFRASIAVLVVIAAGVTGFLLLQSEEAPEEIVREKDVGEIEDLRGAEETLPEVRFVDVTAESGISFVHEDGATESKLLPETMGGGAAFFDYDADGDQDLFFVNGRPWQRGTDDSVVPGNALYRNDGAGRFEDVTDGSGLAGTTYGMGCAVGDYDGDGAIDVLTTGIGGNRLYRNLGGTFEDVTEAAGIGGDESAWTTSAGFFDADGDDDLDLFVCHYVRWSPEIDEEIAYTLNGEDRAYGPPMNYEGSFSTLFRNEGDGTFVDVSEEAGIRVANPATGLAMGKALGVAFLDVDDDGLTDVFVANDTVQNHLFRNEGDGTFAEIGGRSGFGFDRNGGATGAMGIDVGDFRGDGSFGVCIGNFANEMSSLFVKQPGRLRFTDDAMGEGIGSPSRLRLSFGMFFFDYDLDGRLDLLQVNGHLDETISEVQPSQTYLQPPQLFWNQGTDARSCFVEVPAPTTGDLGQDLAGRGSAFADIDADGDLDVVLCQVGRPPVLLRNEQGLGHRWLRVRVEQSGMNRSALGATVELTRGDGAVLRRGVTATRSYLSQSELPVTFGLGDDESIQSIEVVWPDGERQPVPVPATLDEEIVVRRG
ncbi:MAG: CRTAC1 family protein [Planctomycetota bacterium]